MPVVRHLEGSAWTIYNGGSECKCFAQGEEREMTRELADYLVTTFPGHFKIVSDKAAKGAAVAAPEKTAAMKAPAKRKAPAKKAPAKKAPAKKAPAKRKAPAKKGKS